MRETSLEKHLEGSGAGIAGQEELVKLQKEKQVNSMRAIGCRVASALAACKRLAERGLVLS